MSDTQAHNGSNADTSILLVEDEQDLLELLEYNLEREGYKVRTATTGEAGLKAVRSELPDMILLDLMLPGMDGLEVCRTLKSRENTAVVPVIMLTAKGEESDIVRGLELGADDYITKPFSPRVLLARIRALLRRSVDGVIEGDDSRTIDTGQVVIDLERHEVRSSGDVVDLTATEFKLLRLLAARRGRVFTRQQIIESIHEGFAAVTDRSVDVQVVSLRRKLGDVGQQIETVRGVGYRFRD
ncbi:response regulator transcription factor [Mucisphaera calidilacus]|uniref:Alkaline phosphatase synthesis transcriptional regulatory protein PhoP n=1 Tax=Mucisphaera calidilacus TaxID=2527982 RepID=A0A518BYM1_9BACT|nr:response regulator transcription factor [Mucisphaera calidilacus]QDU72071.1 Alkaline phosphatase synthesis transcriptional regulatory protein PhoP [Mucisphaera calidilacus]